MQIELTLEQQFEYRRYVDASKSMRNEHLLDLLKSASNLLKNKTHILDNLLDKPGCGIVFLDVEDPSFQFSQLLIYAEFEKYERESLTNTLLQHIKMIMFTDNHIKKTMFEKLNVCESC